MGTAKRRPGPARPRHAGRQRTDGPLALGHERTTDRRSSSCPGSPTWGPGCRRSTAGRSTSWPSRSAWPSCSPASGATSAARPRGPEDPLPRGRAASPRPRATPGPLRRQRVSLTEREFMPCSPTSCAGADRSAGARSCCTTCGGLDFDPGSNVVEVCVGRLRASSAGHPDRDGAPRRLLPLRGLTGDEAADALVWARVAAVGGARYVALPGSETVPYHIAWATFALCYGLEQWSGAVDRVGRASSHPRDRCDPRRPRRDRTSSSGRRPPRSRSCCCSWRSWSGMCSAVSRLPSPVTPASPTVSAPRPARELLTQRTSHEMRSPLTIARGYLEMLMARHP